MTEETETQTPNTAAEEPASNEQPQEKPRRRRYTRRPRRNKAGSEAEAPATESAETSGEQPAAETSADKSAAVAPAAEEAPAVERAPEAPKAPPQPPPPPTYAEGIVEVSGKGFGFLREPKRNFTQSNNDVFVTPEVIRKHNLRDGMWIRGETRRGPRGPQLYKLTELEGEDPANFGTFPVFEELTTVSPNKRIKLETTPELYTTRVIDLVSPIGRGTRGLIVAPPRTGKTTLLQHIAGAVTKNHPDIKLIILLVDERPEEVTEIRRTCPSAEVMASSNDCDVKTHTRIAQLAIERAKRLVEMGKDVFVLMDSLTRIGRAFNNAQGGGGRTMSGGVDSRALEIPRKLFAAARNTEEAGSLTIMATALIETNSRMDELIFQEFKGTGNMELVLGRLIAEQRIYPAVDIFQSGTRREELLMSPEDLHKINVIRRGLAGHKPIEAIERLLFFIRKYPTNSEMLKSIPG
ncbi:MAG TPA: transcription termination factor Rho [Chthoniobacterales bacterium]